jgi:hypothetical protein
MKKILLYNLSAVAFAFLISIATHAQDRFVYAVTDFQQNGSGWAVLRKLNLQTGVFSDVLLNGIEAKKTVLDAATKKQIDINTSNTGNYLQTPFSTGVAAIAFDKKNNRIYYTPMFIDQLRYIDLKTMSVYYVTNQPFTKLGNLHNDEGKIVTRMVIAPDGYGYALTNDANTFIRFSTGKKLKIESFGSLVDDPSNSGISVHNRCSSYGGDMVADDNGNLYMLSARNNVFKINIETKVAKWLGSVNGLSPNFTINGAAVNDEGKILVGSQGYTQSWYVIDPKNWTAVEYKTPNGIFLTSDLANSNVLKTHKNSTTEIATIAVREIQLLDKIQLYPNPVGNNQFNIQFGNINAGNYTIVLTDVTGRQIIAQKVNVGGAGQIETINLNRNTAKGIYLIKITDISGKAAFTQKLVVQ